MKFEEFEPARQNKIALELAQGAMRTGALAGLQYAIGLRNNGDSSKREIWDEILQTEERWRAIEGEYGRGAVLNFDHPLIARLSEQSGVIRLPLGATENASRYKSASQVPDVFQCPEAVECDVGQF